MIKLLAESGAEMSITTASGVNALHMAAQGNSAIGLNMLLHDYEKSFDLNEPDNSGATSLIWAAFCGSEISLAFLLAQPGIEVNCQNHKGETALHLALQSTNAQKPGNIVKRLMLKGADLTIRDNKGRTPIELCRKRMNKNSLLVEAM